MKYFFTGISRVTLDHATGEKSSRHHATDVRLEISNNLDHKVYLNKGIPTKDGNKALTVALISGLVANIHAGHQYGYWDSAEHLRYVIKHLEEGFSAVANVKESTM